MKKPRQEKTAEEKTAEEKERQRLYRPAFVAQRTSELACLHSWLARTHPEQLRGGGGEQISSSEYVATNLDGWAVRP